MFAQQMNGVLPVCFVESVYNCRQSSQRKINRTLHLKFWTKWTNILQILVNAFSWMTLIIPAKIPAKVPSKGIMCQNESLINVGKKGWGWRGGKNNTRFWNLLCIYSANERSYNVTLYLIGWLQVQNDPCRFSNFDQKVGLGQACLMLSVLTMILLSW